MTREEKISRLKDILSEINENDNAVCYLTSEDNELIESAIEALEYPLWTPVKFRPLTDKEQKEYPDYSYMADCPMPDDGEDILVTIRSSKGGLYVQKDVCYIDDGYYLDSGYDWQTDIAAWMQLPKPYEPPGK